MELVARVHDNSQKLDLTQLCEQLLEPEELAEVSYMHIRKRVMVGMPVQTSLCPCSTIAFQVECR
jgi:hypothetical protein